MPAAPIIFAAVLVAIFVTIGIVAVARDLGAGGRRYR